MAWLADVFYPCIALRSLSRSVSNEPRQTTEKLPKNEKENKHQNYYFLIYLFLLFFLFFVQDGPGGA